MLSIQKQRKKSFQLKNSPNEYPEHGDCNFNHSAQNFLQKSENLWLKIPKGKKNLFFPNLVFLTKMFHWTNSMKILRTLPNFPLRKRKIFCSILESKFKTKETVRKISFSLNYSSEHRESTFIKLASKKCVRNPKTFRSNPKTKKKEK